MTRQGGEPCGATSRKRTHTTKTGKKTTRYYVVLDVGRSIDGRRRQKWHGGYNNSRAEAEQARATLVADICAGTYVAPTRLTIGEWIIDHWLALIAERAKPTTLASYRSIIEHHVLPDVGGVRIYEITGEQLDARYTQHC